MKKDFFIKVLLPSLEGSLFFLALLGFILWGALGNAWNVSWILFFVPDIITSIISAVKRKRFARVNIVFICCFIFFFVCMVCPGFSANLWHPMWVIFLVIPFYYSFAVKFDLYYHNGGFSKSGDAPINNDETTNINISKDDKNINIHINNDKDIIDAEVKIKDGDDNK